MDVDDERLKAIGRLAIAAGALESVVADIKSLLPGASDADRKQQFGALRKKIADLVQSDIRIQELGTLQSWNDWLDASERVMWRRNAILHAFWNVNELTGQVTAWDRRNHTDTEYSAADINAIAEEAQELSVWGFLISSDIDERDYGPDA